MANSEYSPDGVYGRRLEIASMTIVENIIEAMQIDPNSYKIIVEDEEKQLMRAINLVDCTAEPVFIELDQLTQDQADILYQCIVANTMY